MCKDNENLLSPHVSEICRKLRTMYGIDKTHSSFCPAFIVFGKQFDKFMRDWKNRSHCKVIRDFQIFQKATACRPLPITSCPDTLPSPKCSIDFWAFPRLDVVFLNGPASSIITEASGLLVYGMSQKGMTCCIRVHHVMSCCINMMWQKYVRL